MGFQPCSSYIPDGYDKTPRCFSTREYDPCNCGGDQRKCTHYAQVREGALRKENTFCAYCYSACDNRALSEESTMYSGIEMKIIGQCGALRARHYGDKDIFDHQDIVNINFCPMCGRKLRDEEE